MESVKSVVTERKTPDNVENQKSQNFLLFELLALWCRDQKKYLLNRKLKNKSDISNEILME